MINLIMLDFAEQPTRKKSERSADAAEQLEKKRIEEYLYGQRLREGFGDKPVYQVIEEVRQEAEAQFNQQKEMKEKIIPFAPRESKAEEKENKSA